MSNEIISILVLAAVFAIAIGISVNMGLLAFAAAFLVGTLAAGMNADDIFGVFPGDIFVVLVGITYLFAIAQINGTVDWLVKLAMRAVGGRVGAIPWIMFGVAGVLTAIGAVSPAAVAIVAPIALGFAVQFGINPLLMGVMVVHGAQAGGFSPISVYGTIVNDALAEANIAQSEMTVFLASLAFNTLVAGVVFVAFGGVKLLREGAAPARRARRTAGPRMPSGRRVPPVMGGSQQADALGMPAIVDGPLTRPTLHQTATLIGIVVLVAVTLIFDVDVGLVAVSVAVVLTLMAPSIQKKAVDEIKWPVVLLICGVLTYVGVLEEMGTIDWVGKNVADIGAPLIAALLLCYVGAIVSAFASSVGVLGAFIPLAVPFLLLGEVGAAGTVAALAVASTVVDVSPYSTNGALVLANAKGVDQDRFYRQLLIYGAIVVAVAPLLLWFALVVIGG
ncbi:MAG TPA: SLC13 family permease [Thermoleophilaceae bacterium]